MKEANFYKKIKDNIVQCHLCNQFCAIKNGEVGFCHARKNIDGKLYSLVYGYPVALNIDPVEKKPLFHFLPASSTYSLGTFGCNFRCGNCQNWDISQMEEIELQIKKLKYFEPEKIVEEAIKTDCQSIFAEYAVDIMKLARIKGLKNIWVSNGFMSNDCLEAIIPYLDAVNLDIKSFEGEFYAKNCEARLEPVLNNAKFFRKAGIHLEITTLLIPRLNDNEKILKNLADFIYKELGSDTPWHLSKFFPEISWKLKDLSPTLDKSINQAYNIGKKAGLNYVYVGNIHGDMRENTICPKCGELAIERIGYRIKRLDKNGKCAKCGADLKIIN